MLFVRERTKSRSILSVVIGRVVRIGAVAARFERQVTRRPGSLDARFKPISRRFDRARPASSQCAPSESSSFDLCTRLLPCWRKLSQVGKIRSGSSRMGLIH